MDDIGLLELYKGNLVHDRFSSYFPYSCGHSLCNVHILRDLVYAEETFDAPWTKEIRTLPVQAKNAKEKTPDLKVSHYSRIFKRYVNITRPVIKDYDKKFKKTDERRLAFALEKHKYPILKFIEQPLVPFDNNQAERNLRMIKAKQKACLPAGLVFFPIPTLKFIAVATAMPKNFALVRKKIPALILPNFYLAGVYLYPKEK